MTRLDSVPVSDSLMSDHALTNPIMSDNTALHCDVLIIGAGLAGLSTALSLPNHLQVTVLAKQDLQACSSHYAQGGIAAVIDKNDSVSAHVSDTLIAGDGLCDSTATTQILQQGSEAIDWLLAHDVPFTTTSDTLAVSKSSHHAATYDADNEATDTQELKTNAAARSTLKLELDQLHLTQEGGHGRRRVAHADDATGRHIMQSLLVAVAAAENIALMPYHEALSLLTDKGICQGAIVSDNAHTVSLHPLDPMSERSTKTVIPVSAAAQTSSASNDPFRIYSKAVVLASGGLGQLFSRATAPNVCMGDGIMMAWEAGCRLANLEFVQFHPTGLAYTDAAAKGTDQQTDRNFLISEALRGEGAYLLDPTSKARFMPAYDKRAELAPRDIVARAIASEIDKNGLGYVHLDISHQPAQFIQSHFPDIYAHCLSLGIDITTDPIPVAPTAHYTCGGVMTTANGQTDIKGLYAAGEVAHTGLHGANRLASNSLLECVVVGRAVANHIPHYLKDYNQPSNFKGNDCRDNNSDDSLSPVALPLASFVVPIETLNVSSNDDSSDSSNARSHSESFDLDDNAQLMPFTQNESTCTSDQLVMLKRLMASAMGIRRTQPDLSEALAQITTWQQQGVTSRTALDTDPTFDLTDFRWQRLLNLASLMLHSALTRVESRGGHYRNDYPTLSQTAAISIVAALCSKPDIQNNANVETIADHTQLLTCKDEVIQTMTFDKNTQISADHEKVSLRSILC